MEKVNLDSLVGWRFHSLYDIEDKIDSLGAINSYVFKSESELPNDCDFSLDGCLERGTDDDSKYFTLHYLLDRSGAYYITETNYWA